jgi:hypothetical protein
MGTDRSSPLPGSAREVTLARIQDEIEFARALTALLLAARLEDAEHRAEEAYQRIVGSGRFTSTYQL